MVEVSESLVCSCLQPWQSCEFVRFTQRAVSSCNSLQARECAHLADFVIFSVAVVHEQEMASLDVGSHLHVSQDPIEAGQSPSGEGSDAVCQGVSSGSDFGQIFEWIQRMQVTALVNLCCSTYLRGDAEPKKAKKKKKKKAAKTEDASPTKDRLAKHPLSSCLGSVLSPFLQLAGLTCEGRSSRADYSCLNLEMSQLPLSHL